MNILSSLVTSTSPKPTTDTKQESSPYSEKNQESTSPPLKEKKSLENDLRKLLYDERFQDISLKCSDNVTLKACKNILASRTEIFNDLIFNEKRENFQPNVIEFNNINSIAMKFILEYLYTSRNIKETLNVDNIVEIYYASIHFKLDDLQNEILDFTRQSLRRGNQETGKKLLSQSIEKFSLDLDNEIGNILVEWVAKIQLTCDKADNDSLSLQALQYLLKKTFDTKRSFATYELTLFEYTLKKAKHIVIEDRSSLKDNPYDMDYDSSVVEKIKSRMKPLLPYINLGIIDADDVVLKIEPLKIFHQDMITAAYRYRISLKERVLQPMRGRIIFKWEGFDAESVESGNPENRLSITNNGFTVEAGLNLKSYKSVRGDLIIKGNGIHKWDIFVESLKSDIFIGIYGIDGKSFNKPGDKNFHGWALGSDGYIYNNKDWTKWGNTKFKEGDIINVEVDMKTKLCFFGIGEDIRRGYYCNAFPDNIYPFVTLSKGSKLHVISY